MTTDELNDLAARKVTPPMETPAEARLRIALERANAAEQSSRLLMACLDATERDKHRGFALGAIVGFMLGAVPLIVAWIVQKL